jgi:hypothetical protein
MMIMIMNVEAMHQRVMEVVMLLLLSNAEMFRLSWQLLVSTDVQISNDIS